MKTEEQQQARPVAPKGTLIARLHF